MKVEDATAALELALQASGLVKASEQHRSRLLLDNGSSYISDDLAEWMKRHRIAHIRGAPYHPMTRERALAPDDEEPDPARNLATKGARASLNLGRPLCQKLWRRTSECPFAKMDQKRPNRIRLRK
jgi:transposase InsO family protein